jgi:hypothetical protein
LIRIESPLGVNCVRSGAVAAPGDAFRARQRAQAPQRIIMASAASVSSQQRMQGPAPAILIGGLIAGGLDLIAAYISFGVGVPRVIAAGLLGPAVIRSANPAIYALGVFLEFFIAMGAAAVYYAFSRKLDFLRHHFFICGLYFGIAVYLVMNLIVLPLCALHANRPIAIPGMIQGLLVHMLLIGVPIAYCVKRFS